MKHILSLLDLEKTDVDHLIARALKLKERSRSGVHDALLGGRTLGLIFNKPSTRTRVSFEAAMAQLGGTSFFLSAQDTQMGRDEPVKDTARVLSRYLDALAIRTFSQDLLDEFANYATIPIINALTDLFHPCQVLSDLMTVTECKGRYEGVRIAWIGDGNNVAHSWINAAAVLGLDLILACPPGFLPQPEILTRARETSGRDIAITGDPREAAAAADVIYTDVWASMGQESESKLRQQHFTGFQVDGHLLKLARKDAVVMHCLPAHRGEEISEEVLEGPQSVVWDQAENKLHMHKAILEVLINQSHK